MQLLSRRRADVDVLVDAVTAEDALARLDALGDGWFGAPHAVVSGDRLTLRMPGSSSHPPALLRASVRSSGTGVRIVGEVVESGARTFVVVLFALLAVVFTSLGAFDALTSSGRWWAGLCFGGLMAGMAWWMQALRGLGFRTDLERLREAVRTAVEGRSDG